MYKIIGGDGKVYGPVALEQLRQWIAEGRVNAQTLVQTEGNAEWKALANYPELLPAVPPPVTHIAPPKPPSADAKIAAGLCGILLGGFGIHKFVLGYTNEGVTMLLITILGGIVTCGMAAIVMQVIGFVEGIIYLTMPDETFVATYLTSKKGWF